QDYQTAEHLYTQALALDPAFALAHARLSTTLAYIYLNFQPKAEIKARARAEAEEALRLRPDGGAGHLARALCLYWTERDYEGALRELQACGRLLPNNPEVDFYTAAIHRRQGRWNDALAKFDHAVALDPRNALFVRELLNTYAMLRDWTAARRTGERAVQLAPDLPLVRIENSYVALWSGDDLGPLRHTLGEIPRGVDPDGKVTLARWDAALLMRDFAAAQREVETSAAATVLMPFGATPLPKSYLLGCIALARGEVARAQPLFEAGRTAMESEVRDFPLDAFRHAQLGLLYAYLGRKEDALREGRRAVELLPESKDAYFGSDVSAYLALIYARSGEPDQALELIERLLVTAGPVTRVFEPSITFQELRLRWQWDPLRGNPRFQKLLAGPEPKTVYR
ncbi:MAG: tetratricopeptide repeat protein, partial [Chthoniobacterales bacterium]